METITKTINLRHGHGITKIRIGRGILKNILILKEVFSKNKSVFWITNRKVNGFYGKSLRESLKSTVRDSGCFLHPDGERAKDIHFANLLYENLITIGFDKSWIIAATGGGVTTDLAGFVASTFLRGVKWVALPTTLIGQVDAAIGGKTAVNHEMGKNLIGTFWHPDHVIIDPETLTSLNPKEIRCGLAEVVKYGMIADPKILNVISGNMDDVLRVARNPIDDLIYRCVKIKARIVQKDECDMNIRHHLNFGHTFAHALESHGRYKGINHGQAVAVGMLFATNLAVLLDKCGKEVYNELSSLLKMLDLIKGPFTFDRNQLMPFMARDKKKKGDKIRFVLPEKIGRVSIVEIPLRMLNEKPFWSFD